MRRLLVVLLALSIWGCMENKGGAKTYFRDGAALAHSGEYAAAIQKYDKGLKIEPDNPIGYNLLGMAYRFRFNQTGANGDKEKEIQSFEKAIELDPKFWVAHKNMAATLYYQGRKKDALPYIEKALMLRPNDPEKPLLLQWIKEGKQQ